MLICSPIKSYIFENNLLIPPTAQKLHLNVQMGEHLTDHSTDKTKDNMEILENSLSHLIDQMVYITKHQEYHRVNEYLSIFTGGYRSAWSKINQTACHLF